ncbi:MAG: hypothetical protein IT424_15790 [Pirellulales bacterium]|nr:hypothetical protein [Pirellulales bacterium]
MQIRGITQDEVISTIRNPEETGLPTQPGRHRFRTYRGDKRALDAVFEEHTRIVVVTAMKVSLRTKHRRP